MDLFKLNIFRASIFKQAKFLFTSPQKAQTAYYISEAGTVSKDVIPMHTGFMCPADVKKAWVVIHSLKFQTFNKGLPTPSDAALAISDRSYIPLDPNATMKKTDREQLTSLKDIASMRHAEARSDVAPGQDERVDIAQKIINICAVIISILVVGYIIQKVVSGGGA